MDLVISGLGMATSLGGVVAGSAAQRAGLSRTAELAYFHARENGSLQPLVGHCAVPPRVTAPVDRWTEMALQALRELLLGDALEDRGDARFWRRTALMAAVPVLDPARFQAPAEQVADVVRDKLLGGLVAELGVPFEPELLFVVPRGQTAAARALALAREGIRGARFERALVAVVDSHVHHQSLDWLASSRRVKTPDDPAGLSPSEAAVCLLVESRAACARRLGHALSTVVAEDVVEARSPVPDNAGWTNGQRLAQAASNVLGSAAETREPFVGDAFLDLNGEPWRARAWGCARSRLSGRVDWARARVLSPNREFGDTGAATAALALVLGTRAFARGYAGSRRSLICSLAREGEASAVMLGRE